MRVINVITNVLCFKEPGILCNLWQAWFYRVNYLRKHSWLALSALVVSNFMTMVVPTLFIVIFNSKYMKLIKSWSVYSHERAREDLLKDLIKFCSTVRIDYFYELRWTYSPCCSVISNQRTYGQPESIFSLPEFICFSWLDTRRRNIAFMTRR